MIIDAHCHAWPRWPYEPPVPDDEWRGRIEQLLFEMEQCGVQRAVIICAPINRNPENNEYIAEQVRRFPGRLVQFPDIDSRWTATYHTPGAAGRLAALVDRLPVGGISHYLKDDDDGSWLISDEGVRFFRVADDRNLIVSLACRPHQQAAICAIAERFPSVPILCNHLSRIGAREGPASADLKEVLASASRPNIYLKVSGFGYAARVGWEYPYADVLWTVRALYEQFGPRRMCWGSDYPVVRRYMTYRQSLEVFRTHCTFVPEADKAWILGGTMRQLLDARERSGAVHEPPGTTEERR
jgi:predicted TIM-barrel fold metal-dependent hydrolase